VAYHYAPGHGAEHACALFAGFNGVLQVDSYGGYHDLAAPSRSGGAIALAYCWSHFRRQFYDLAKGGNAPIATAALDKIGGLYCIEDEIRGEPADARRTARQQRTKPIVEALKTWLGGQLPKLPRASETAKAINYGLNHWDGLTRFLDDGRIEIDTNTVERTIRPIALNRNYAQVLIMRRWLDRRARMPVGRGSVDDEPDRQLHIIRGSARTASADLAA
jgi:transposase